jgi:hypothetical protein
MEINGKAARIMMERSDRQLLVVVYKMVGNQG